MRWCSRSFGPERLSAGPAVPGPDLLPPGFTGTDAEIDVLFRRVCAVMGVDPDTVTVLLFESPAEDEITPGRGRDGRRTVGCYREVDGRAVIELDRRKAAEPAVLAAVIAHELGHVRLLGEGRIEGHEADHEKLTDLVTVFLGMGVFTANAAYRFGKSVQGWSALPLGDLTERMLTGTALGPSHHLGYLTERQFGYALACYCLLREETDPPWARHLDPGVRAVLRDGLRYFAHRGARGQVPHAPGQS
jgi:hypothetical protein